MSGSCPFLIDLLVICNLLVQDPDVFLLAAEVLNGLFLQRKISAKFNDLSIAFLLVKRKAMAASLMLFFDGTLWLRKRYIDLHFKLSILFYIGRVPQVLQITS